jgi:hypothetical protein
MGRAALLGVVRHLEIPCGRIERVASSAGVFVVQEKTGVRRVA